MSTTRKSDLASLDHPSEPESIVSPSHVHGCTAQTAGEIAQKSRLLDSVEPAPETESPPGDVAGSSVDLGRTYGPLTTPSVWRNQLIQSFDRHNCIWKISLNWWVKLYPRMIDELPSMESSSVREASPRPDASKRKLVRNRKVMSTLNLVLNAPRMKSSFAKKCWLLHVSHPNTKDRIKAIPSMFSWLPSFKRSYRKKSQL